MKKHNSLVTLGITSLFLIFAVLCLVILSLLSLGASRSDLSMSRQNMEQTTNYFKACNTATGLCEEIEKKLIHIYEENMDETTYYRAVSTEIKEVLELQEVWELQEVNQIFFSTADKEISDSISYIWNPDEKQLLLEIPFSETQILSISLDVLYPKTDHDYFLQIRSWKTALTGNWSPDNKQPIFQGD